MFEQEISFNISQVNSEFDSNKNSISLKEILQNDNIENRFKKFLKMKLNIGFTKNQLKILQIKDMTLQTQKLHH